eukprot:TRINITY_DN6644_c0_g1_i1.p1 TRINITY_DN6644_c0_g1~~TRINITY_DN6644_c0_g1_i1.p1  ORF type:complete len:302 (+),score=71.02 TRINITY_DN6644_c0_g1_i1:525-1430(+)
MVPSSTGKPLAAPPPPTNPTKPAVFKCEEQSSNSKKRKQTPSKLWTPQEHQKLQQLLEKYPETIIESHRWENIARELGNRTPKQVASRVYKYFIKLAKAGLPVPGRVPRLETSKKKLKMDHSPLENIKKNDSSKRTIHTTNIEYYKPPPVQMLSEHQILAREGKFHVNDICQLAGSKEYEQLVELLHMRQQQEREKRVNPNQCLDPAVHLGIKCVGCHMEPIKGTRWKCLDCPNYLPVDLCELCVEKEWRSDTHNPITHVMNKIEMATFPFFVDQDYVKYQIDEEIHEGGASYLDPTFMPL